MGDSSITTNISFRLPNEWIELKKDFETNTEFAIRAFKALRDTHTNKGNNLEHNLLVRMIKVFAKNKINMKLNKEEIKMVKEIYNDNTKSKK